MNDQKEIDILHDVKFKTMTKQRNRFALFLTLIVLAVYFSFMATATFNPNWLARTWGDGAMTIGMPIAAGVIILSWLVTGIYIAVANQYFDRQKEQIKRDHHYE